MIAVVVLVMLGAIASMTGGSSSDAVATPEPTRIAEATPSDATPSATPDATASTAAASPSASPVGFAIIAPANGSTVAAAEVSVSGTAPAGATIVRDISLAPDQYVTADDGGKWTMTVDLKTGANELAFRLGDDEATTVYLRLTYAPGPTIAPTVGPEPTVTPTPAVSVKVTVKYTTETFEGGYLNVVVRVTNRGKAKTEPARLQFGDLKDHADLVGCNPTCSSSEFFGDVFTEFESGIKPGKTATYKVRFLATKTGVVDWNVGVYIGGPEQVFFGTGTTVIH